MNRALFKRMTKHKAHGVADCQCWECRIYERRDKPRDGRRERAMLKQELIAMNKGGIC